MAAVSRWFRVEHRDGERVTPLGRVPDAFPHQSSLGPYLSRLLLEGERRGELVLIDEASGRVVARRAVRPPWRPPRS